MSFYQDVLRNLPSLSARLNGAPDFSLIESPWMIGYIEDRTGLISSVQLL